MPRVSDLTEALSIADSDFLYAVVGGNSRKVRKDTLIPTTPVSGIKPQAAIVAAGQTELAQTGIPTWVNRVNVNLSLLSTSGTNDILIQVGNGAYVTTGYVVNHQGFTGGSLGLLTSTAGFIIDVDANTNQQSAVVTLSRFAAGSNTWIATCLVRRNGSSNGYHIGEITLAGALDRVRATTVGGTDTFDAGAFAASWE